MISGSGFVLVRLQKMSKSSKFLFSKQKLPTNVRKPELELSTTSDLQNSILDIFKIEIKIKHGSNSCNGNLSNDYNNHRPLKVKNYNLAS